ncbi:FAV1 [[Candida] subhashii]|uniref:FAV1 n=1 Tax=[Candida] subhashii TaxID=561895 RepID=A0A8J5UR07_9ASCO|nr:FAV1 [[Candida] subhashii]KAG7665101.1 FAV1 [[Candida] subhashii]
MASPQLLNHPAPKQTRLLPPITYDTISNGYHYQKPTTDPHCPSWLQGISQFAIELQTPPTPPPKDDYSDVLVEYAQKSSGVVTATSMYSPLEYAQKPSGVGSVTSMYSPTESGDIERNRRSRGSWRRRHSSSGVKETGIKSPRESEKKERGKVRRQSVDGYKVIGASTDGIMFDCQSSLVDLLNYLITKYQEIQNGIGIYGNWWLDCGYKQQTFDTIAAISCSYRKLIIDILKELNNHSTINTMEEFDDDNDHDLMNCNVFQIVYNCQIERINLMRIFDYNLFIPEFKFMLLRYFYRLTFITSQVLDQRSWLIIPLEIWYKLPSLIKSINDSFIKFKSNHDLGITLVKLNAITQKFPIVEEIRKHNKLIDWSDFEKIDRLLASKFPDYTTSNGKHGYGDYNNNGPLSSSHDMKMSSVKPAVQPNKKKEHIIFPKLSLSKIIKKNNNNDKDESESKKDPIVEKDIPKRHAQPAKSHDGKSSCYEVRHGSSEKRSDHSSNERHSDHSSSEKHSDHSGSSSKERRKKSHRPKVDLTPIQHQIDALGKFRKKLSDIGPELLQFLSLQLEYCIYWQQILNSGGGKGGDTSDNLYIRSACKAYYEKIQNQLEFTRSTIMFHIEDRLIIPIDQCLRLCYRGKGNQQDVNRFMELIVIQYNKLYCKWLEGMIGPRSIQEYEILCKKIGTPNGDDISQYYYHLANLKSLVG